MPASGDIGLKFCQGTACSSICVAVGGSLSNLSALGATANKAAPVSMRNFYNYVGPAAYHAIGYSNISATGTVGTTARCSLDCLCSNPASIANQCYTITLCHNMCSNTATGSRSFICVCCNGAGLYGCQVAAGGAAASFSCTLTATGGETFCFWMCALHPPVGGTGISCAQTCITSVANASPTYGLFCIGASSCCCCVVYTC